MENQKIQLDHVNFTVKNFKESVEWYKKVFNFELVEQGRGSNNQKWGILKNGDSMLAISEYPNRTTESCSQHHKIYHFGLRLNNRDRWLKTIEDHQLKIYYGGAVQYPYSESWYVADPTGNEIEVSIWQNNIVRF